MKAAVIDGYGGNDMVEVREVPAPAPGEKEVSKSSFHRSKRVLGPDGIYVATLPSPAVLLNQYLAGYFTRRKARLVMVRPNAADMEWLRERIEAGEVRVVIDRSYPLEKIREAFAYSETGKARGKVVVTMGQKHDRGLNFFVANPADFPLKSRPRALRPAPRLTFCPSGNKK
jgi:NADPH:quinone reductase-like Zn-dependent oxidoreductase